MLNYQRVDISKYITTPTQNIDEEHGTLAEHPAEHTHTKVGL